MVDCMQTMKTINSKYKHTGVWWNWHSFTVVCLTDKLKANNPMGMFMYFPGGCQKLIVYRNCWWLRVWPNALLTTQGKYDMIHGFVSALVVGLSV